MKSLIYFKHIQFFIITTFNFSIGKAIIFLVKLQNDVIKKKNSKVKNREIYKVKIYALQYVYSKISSRAPKTNVCFLKSSMADQPQILWSNATLHEL